MTTYRVTRTRFVTLDVNSHRPDLYKVDRLELQIRSDCLTVVYRGQICSDYTNRSALLKKIELLDLLYLRFRELAWIRISSNWLAMIGL